MKRHLIMRVRLVVWGLVGAMLGTAALSAHKPATAQMNNCIDIQRMRSTHALDDSTILATLRGNEFAKISLASRCIGLRIQDGFSYATSITKLCPGDIITVLGGGGDRCSIATITPLSALASLSLGIR